MVPESSPKFPSPLPDQTCAHAPELAEQAGASAAVTRRTFLGGVGTAAAAVAGGVIGTAALPGSAAANPPAPPINPAVTAQRRTDARNLRHAMAQLAFLRPVVPHPNNGEEVYAGRIASFHKGLPHNALGEVDAGAYNQLLFALNTGDPAAFEAIPLGGVRKLRNPLSGLSFDLEGPDSHHLFSRPAPRIDGPENSGEMAELYWMALTRDVHFSDFGSNADIAAAVADLNNKSDFRGPKSGGAVTPDTVFRGNTPGDLAGPYLSQFLLKDIPYGSLTVSQKQTTVMPGIEYMTAYGDWLSVQNGNATGPDVFDPTSRYIRNGRDLGQYVHVDALYEAYLNACLILLGMGAPEDAGNPYLSSNKTDGFGTFGGPHILSLVTEVATRALKAVWYQKWFVHRRLRPEAFGGVVHNRITNPAAAGYPVNAEILNSTALPAVFSKYGTYLLPQAFPEGSPLHPSYGAGHATVAAACVTILKAWFDESFVIPSPVVASSDGLSLLPWVGAPLTLGGELNKVAANVATGRNFAGIHWRTDMSESLKLGEAVAIGILEEQKATYRESSSFTLTKFDGTTVTI